MDTIRQYLHVRSVTDILMDQYRLVPRLFQVCSSATWIEAGKPGNESVYR